MSVKANVIYANKPDAQFDLDYYLNTHMPLVDKHWGPFGLKSWEIIQYNRGLEEGSKPDFIIQAILTWESSESVAKATASDAAKIVLDDIPKFTNIQPHFVAGDVVGQSS